MTSKHLAGARHRSPAEGPSTLSRGTRALIATTLVVTLSMVAVPAFAYWNAVGTGSGAAPTGALAAVSGVTAAVSRTTDVAVSWTPAAEGVTPTGYYVLRTSADSTVAACGSSATTLVSSPNCTDTPTADGAYSYLVVAVYRSWSSQSTASPPVNFSTAAATITITNGASYTTATPTPVISGTTSAATGSSVAVTIGSHSLATTSQSSHTWSITASTLANGTYSVTATVHTAAGSTSATQTLTVAASPSPSAIALNSAGSYSVLADGLITSSGKSVLNGDVGTSPDGSMVGFPPATYTGTAHVNDSVSAAAAADFAAAVNDARGRTIDAEFAGDLNGRTFTAGVYHSAAAITITGAVTLDGKGNPNAVFIFLGDAALNTAAASQVVLKNGARASNVFWVNTGAAGIGANASFSGIILAQGAITVGDQASFDGRALTAGAVTLTSNTLSSPE